MHVAHAVAALDISKATDAAGHPLEPSGDTDDGLILFVLVAVPLFLHALMGVCLQAATPLCVQDSAPLFRCIALDQGAHRPWVRLTHVVARADVRKVAKSPKCRSCATGSECLLVARRFSSRPLRRENCVRTPDVRVFCRPWASTGISCTSSTLWPAFCVRSEVQLLSAVAGNYLINYEVRRDTVT